MNEKLEKIKKRFEQICFGPNKELIDKTIAIEIIQEILEEIPEVPILETAEFNSNYYELSCSKINRRTNK